MIREDRRRGVYVDGLSEWVVRSPAEVYQLMEMGQSMVRGRAGGKGGVEGEGGKEKRHRGRSPVLFFAYLFPLHKSTSLHNRAVHAALFILCYAMEGRSGGRVEEKGEVSESQEENGKE